MHPVERLLKEAFHRTAAAALCLITAPVFLLTAIIIKWHSKGPVFFTQERIGLDEQPFRIFKFRTMHVTMPARSSSSVTLRDDPRLFPGARLLRKWKIDELPQLLNVLNGTMSLVGPRPTVREDYDRMTPAQRRRAAVKPGITGLAQISGGTALYWPERIQLDLEYIRGDRLIQDIRILLKTALVVLTGSADTHPIGDDEWGPSEPAAIRTSIPSAQGVLSMSASRSTSQPAPRTYPLWPEFSTAQIDAVAEVLRSGKVNYWTGDEARVFEAEFAQAVGTDHAIALANGTVALELALYAMEIGPGDEVIVPCRTFIATASAVAMRGATPVFADVDFESQNITAETIEPLITDRTRAVIVVHLAGRPCAMDAIMQLAADRGLRVIEDCAQAHGAAYRGRPVGSLGDAAAFSFCQDKIMTTGGEGGMLTTNDPALWERAWSFKDHGKGWDAVHHRQHNTVFKWLHESLGTNWRMTEMQAAIGRQALRALPAWVEQRRHNAAILDAAFEHVPALRVTRSADNELHSYYKHYVFLRSENLRDGWTRDDIVLRLQEAGIPCGSGICPEIYRENAFADTGWAPRSRRPVARELGETSLMFCVHPTLTEADMQQIASTAVQVVEEATAATPLRRAA